MKFKSVFGVLTGGKGANLCQSFKCCLSSLYTTVSSEVVNHASTVNIFSCETSQFQLPQNFISQIDRGNIALSLEYHFSNESHVPGRDFCR